MAISKLINKTLAKNIKIIVEKYPQTIASVEYEFGAYTIGWNII